MLSQPWYSIPDSEGLKALHKGTKVAAVGGVWALKCNHNHLALTNCPAWVSRILHVFSVTMWVSFRYDNNIATNTAVDPLLLLTWTLQPPAISQKVPEHPFFSEVFRLLSTLLTWASQIPLHFTKTLWALIPAILNNSQCTML